MPIKVNNAICTGCQNCYHVCPQGAIGLNRQNEIVISDGRCTECGQCVTQCPVDALTITQHVSLPVDPKSAKLLHTAHTQPSGVAALQMVAYITKGREQSAVTKPALHVRYSSAFNTRYGTYRTTIDIPIALTTEARQRPRKRLGEMVRESKAQVRPISNAFEEIGSVDALNREQLAEVVLNFVQAIPFVTDKTSVGLVDYHSYPAETLAIGVADCEDKSIIAAAIYKNLGYDVVLFNPPHHIAVGLAGQFKGYKIDYEGTPYYYAETTIPGWHWGEMPTEYIETEMNVIEV